MEVPAGQGILCVIDYNDNGIKELNEFRWRPSATMVNYVRVFVPGNTFGTHLQQPVHSTPRRHTTPRGGLVDKEDYAIRGEVLRHALFHRPRVREGTDRLEAWTRWFDP